MDAAENWNGLGDYSLFLPEDSFNLFGEYDLDLGLNNSFLPALDEASATFDIAEWDQIEAMIPALPRLDATLPTSGEPQDLIPNPEAELQASKYTSTSSPSSARSPISEDQTSTDGFPVSGKEVEHQTKTELRKREFLTAFSVESGEEIQLHTRKRFSKEQRQVVALNRIIGVCLHCRLRKVACDDGIPCNRCIKRAGSISSGQEICMRRSLVATRFDHIGSVFKFS
ncbi:uncharacterized protein K444DRAFT_322470 [Hyaloscypha bicolor E]|uniref:Zn(2)-C6 fungal-type domain-containing protein n=1 Tax=Hyaloscypha bicolor E TaxID=1095630 RepID=A0A2J6TKI2_9HELO|nr:uncharacterized protein K444DRAFT_322470 [Hyaloscypha bicolor E]PMD63517.1 hypothetical protein K444DRAFT_322470 [Hyaloscypha bicolor E]